MTTLFSLDVTWGAILNDMALDPDDILRKAKIPADFFDRANPKATFDQFVAIWNACVDSLNRSDFPVVLGTTMNSDVYSPPLIAAHCSENFSMAVKRLQQYKALCGPLLLSADEHEKGVKIQMQTTTGDILPESYHLTECVFFTQLLRNATRKPLCPMVVATPLAQSISPALEDYFGIKLTQSIETYVVFDEAAMKMPFVTENKSLWKFLEPQLDSELAKISQHKSMTERVTALLVTLIPAGSVSIDQIADKLFMSKRTLQRKLNAEGISFQQLLNNVREKLAVHYLTGTDLPSNQIAFMLGFDDPNSFIRAFSKWRGISPEAARRQHNDKSALLS